MKLSISKQKGFTLIELLVVISIISFLSSIVLAALQEARNKANDSKVKSQLSNMRVAAEQIYNSSSYGNAIQANDCAGLTNNPTMASFMSANKWPTIGGQQVVPVCYSDALAGGEIKEFSIWHKTNQGGWCVDSTGMSGSIANAPDASTCGGGGGNNNNGGGNNVATLGPGDQCIDNSECINNQCNLFNDNTTRCALPLTYNCQIDNECELGTCRLSANSSSYECVEPTYSEPTASYCYYDEQCVSSNCDENAGQCLGNGLGSSGSSCVNDTDCYYGGSCDIDGQMSGTPFTCY